MALRNIPRSSVGTPERMFLTMKTLGGSETSKKVENVAPVQIKTVKEKIDFSKVKIEPLFEEMVDFDTFTKSDYRAVKVKACEAVPKSKKLLKFILNDVGICAEGKNRIFYKSYSDNFVEELSLFFK